MYEPESLGHQCAVTEMLLHAHNCSEKSQCDDAQLGIWVLAFPSVVEIVQIDCFWEVLH